MFAFRTICFTFFIVFLATLTTAMAQSLSVYGSLSASANGKPIANAQVGIHGTSLSALSDKNGFYKLSGLKPGKHIIAVYAEDLQAALREVELTDKDVKVDIVMYPFEKTLNEVVIRSQKDNNFGITRLKSVEGTAIYEAKKTEVIVLEDVNANLATNNTRQIFAKVAGLNIWESDGAGIQLGIGGRGLNPNRTAEFNVRQNGYDITADALGYPEAYYTPPAEALERIEVVRGAASLQYGTQFGGMVNFVFKKGPEDKPLEIVGRQTVGSFGFVNSFNSIGGTKGKFNYYGFYQRKQGNGWRPNSAFSLNMAYGSVSYALTPSLSIKGEYTFMNYLTRQAGGLTDVMFRQDPRQSVRERNWFAVDWNLPAVTVDYRISDRTKFNSRTFGLLSSRNALGVIGLISRYDDPSKERDLIADEYRNFGNETRLAHRYTFLQSPSTLVVGTRYFKGNTHKMQGKASSGYDADFTYLNPEDLGGSDYRFPSSNFAAFAENIFPVTPRLTITPGIRYEYITTNANGYFVNVISDQAGNPIATIRQNENKTNTRSFVLMGVGTSYKQSDDLEYYANISQNYRAINFNDFRIVNPNVRVNPDIKDERGYNADFGFRGNIQNLVNFDVSLFYLSYNDRIGSVQRVDSTLYTLYRYRTNISDSRNAGLEMFAETDVLKLFSRKERVAQLSVFGNFSFIDARYINSEEPAVRNKKVEQVPPVIIKSGLAYARKGFKASYQASYIGRQYTDATNAKSDPNAVIGEIPAYWVMDMSISYTYKKFTLSGSVNNLTDNRYFTRRADGYPGPGIIPSDARSYFTTLEYRF